MNSYVSIEKRIDRSYRADLNNAKKPEEVREIFVKTVAKILSEISGNFVDEEEIKFDPTKEEIFSLGKVKDNPKINEALSESDLPAILDRLAEEAKNRYLHLIHDNDRTDMFKKHPF